MVNRLRAPVRCAFCLYRESQNKIDIHKSLDRAAPTDCHVYCRKCPNCQRYKSRHDFKNHLKLCKRGIQRRFMCPTCLQRRVPNTDDATTEYTLAKLHMGGIEDAISEDDDEVEIYEFPSETSADDEETSTTEDDGSITLSSEQSFSAQSGQSIDSLVQEITSVVRKPKLASDNDDKKGIKRKSLSSRHREEDENKIKLVPKRRRVISQSSSSEDDKIQPVLRNRQVILSSDSEDDKIRPALRKRREIVSSDSEDDIIRPALRKRRVIVSSDSEDEIQSALKKRRVIVSSDDSSESFANSSPPLPAAESISSDDSPNSSPRQAPLPPPPAAMPQNQGRCRGRPPKRNCTRLRDGAGRFIPEPNLIRVVRQPKRKRRTELELLLSYSYSSKSSRNGNMLTRSH